MAHFTTAQAPITTNPAFPASIFQQAPKSPPKPKYSGFKTRREEELYDNVAGSLMRLMSMRMAMTFSIAVETPNMIRRMRKEDD